MSKTFTRTHILRIGAAVVVVLLSIAAIVYFAFFHITRADYTNAATATNEVINSYNSTQATLIQYRTAAVTLGTTDADLATKAQQYATSRAQYETVVGDLSKLYALKDTDVRNAKEAFMRQNALFSSSTHQLAEILPTIREKEKNCSESVIGGMDTGDLAKLTEAYDAATTPCIVVMKKLSSAQLSGVAAAGKSALAYFATMREHIVAMQTAYGAGNRATFESEYKAFLAKANEFDANTDMSTATAPSVIVSASKELNTLMTVIQKRLK